MAGWPPVETPLNEQEQQAYRSLLYQAMVDIRNLCQSRGSESLNPLEWRRQYRESRVAGALADWLHNLADFASRDFKGFDADIFWREYEGLSKRVKYFGAGRYLDYRQRFQRHLADQGAA